MFTEEDPRVTEIINNALLSENPLVKRALKEENDLRKNTEKEIKELLVATRKAVLFTKIENIEKSVIKQIELDLELAKKLNDVLKTYSPTINPDSTLQQCTYPLKFNKLDLILEGSQAFLKDNFIPLFIDENKEMPQGYQFKTVDQQVTRLGWNDLNIYGNSKNSFLKAALLETYCVSTGKTVDNLGFNGCQTGEYWVDRTSMAHVAPLPETLRLELPKLDERFKNFTFGYSDQKTPQGILYVHSGYTYGGDRIINNKERVRKDKQSTPEDCSSWLEKICGGSKPFIFTTADQLFHYYSKSNIGNVSKEWSSSTGVNMDNTFDVVDWQKDPQILIQPGTVYAHRAFNLQNDPKKEWGTGGHTALVLGFISDKEKSRVVTLGYDRGMPTEEGFGVKEFPLYPTPEANKDKTVMIFNVKKR